MLSRAFVGSFGAFAVVCGLIVTLGGCPTDAAPLPSDVVGNAAAGQQTFTDTCARCHTARSVANGRNRINNNLGTISVAMRGITLTNQEVADLREFLATQ